MPPPNPVLYPPSGVHQLELALDDTPSHTNRHSTDAATVPVPGCMAKSPALQAGYTEAELACLQQPRSKLREPPPHLLEPPQTLTCPAIEAAFGGKRGTPVPLAGAPDCTERYSNLLHCGGATLLLRRAEARRGPTIHHDYWWTVVRSISSSPSPAATSALTTIPTELNMSHNAAFTCAADGQTVVAYGGRRKPWRGWLGRRDEPGIFRAEGRLQSRADGAVSIAWSRPAVVLDGSAASGCVERRSRVGPNCEFDGKLSVTKWRGRTLLYARANVAQCGGRHVQMTSSLNGVDGWARWQLLDFGRALQLGAATNLYFFTVRVVSDRLVAFFPTVVGLSVGRP